ncbi:hypothetical protein CAPTEDRAFT_179683 [Capitella teleta]|uniref:Major facilitator superfamily (MFS) profile domain-containing protein n=1 Tax=Capitella teleta TaxID=283909 RepID=R7UU52_CAPTE|nr:hypothetical protein CAPTEDRAFT_179683 [Capitella teleta]|eukprot:ELU07452.1 hypothetical protein CAPTEDRAFT_179683 [Capitella teleta]
MLRFFQAVILPTAWLYLRNNFNANTESLGLLLSAFSLAGLISSPIMGRICDKTKNTRAVLLAANCFEIVGSIMYFMGISTWFLIGSRFIAGIGTGVEACLFADIARATSKEERTGVMSIFMAVRQLGLVTGPACNLFLRALNFQIRDFAVDKFTSPGLFMALMWLVLQVFVTFLYWDLPRLRLQENLQQEQAAYNRNSLNEPSLPAPALENQSSLVFPPTPGVERKTLEQAASLPRPTPSRDFDSPVASSNQMIETVEQFLREEIVAIITTAFVAFFNQAMLTPLTKELLDWGELENSLFFAVAGVEIILVFLLIRFLSSHLKDRTLIVIGFTIECITVAFFLWFLPQCVPHDPRGNLPGFLIGCLVDVFGLPFLAVASTSLFSKITQPETQGLAQGIRRLFVGLGVILGPLWAGSMVSRHLYSMLGVMLALNLIAAMMLVLSFRKLQPPEDNSVPTTPSLHSNDSHERQHLLS